MATTRTSVVALILAPFALGCGRDRLALDELADAYARAYCAKIFRCCDDAETAQIAMALRFTDERDCQNAAGQQIGLEVANLRPRLDAGEVRYDDDAGAECIEQIADGACAEFTGSRNAPACDAVFVGTADLGAACDDDLACASLTCETVCVEPIVLDEPRDDGAACDDDALCKSGDCDASGVCVASTYCNGD